MQNQSNLIIENNVLNIEQKFGYKFSMPSDYIIYFEKKNNIALNKYIRNNYDELRDKFSKLNFNLIYAPLLTNTINDLDKVVEYFLPQLTYYEIPKKVKNKYGELMFVKELNKGIDDYGAVFPEEDFIPTSYNYNDILKFIGYNGDFNSGFTLLNNVIGVSDTFYVNNNNGDFSSFFIEFEDYLEEISNLEYDAMIANIPPIVDLTEKLDEEAAQIVNDLKEKLAALSDSGQLLFIVPILKDLLDKQTEKIDFKSISKITIDKQNNIVLPYFKKEVKLSHLTKSVYFLFLKHPEGINLKELAKYKKELLTIYVSVSNQLDHDKMIKSIEDVVNLETKAIYTHLSRIKSAFYKIMDASHANHYIVSGNGENNRKVLFNTKAVDWYLYDPTDDYELY
ncbi:hypothetical protein [Flavobacterium sp.]|uniref:hypothetical protein n=1 Tax=Flavobacterium sp. TaxID=239 RepID=UPI001B652BF7|nr:hypothetical protein [Flavobacterium sp.]MBP6128237.1 hypothetical protein [Flavobacterium sp.]